MKELLYTAAQKINIKLNDTQLDQFEKYYNILIETNKVMNLTAITEENEVIYKHFIDSIAVINKYELNNKNIIDVGTGAGFPGIPLAIIMPNSKFTLMDSLNKRVKFLNNVIDICNLDNVSTVHSRAEDLGRDKNYREQFDVCVSRAVANMSTLLEYCMPFVKVKGMFISYKASDIEDELKTSITAQKKLSCKLVGKEKMVLPDTDIARNFVEFEKVNVLNKAYPRQAGKPKKEPL